MGKYFVKKILQDLFGSFSEEERELFFRITGVASDAPEELFYGGLKACAEFLENTRSTEQRQREISATLKGHAMIADAATKRMGDALGELSQSIEKSSQQGRESLDAAIKSLVESGGYYGNGGSFEGSGLAESRENNIFPILQGFPVNCPYRHESSEKHPEGRDGPPGVLEKKVEGGNSYGRCRLAYTTNHNARFPDQHWLHVDGLRAKGCPRAGSLSLLNNLSFIEWLNRPNICKYAGGDWVEDT